MDYHPLEREKTNASVSRRSILSRMRRESNAYSAEDVKGPLGLNILFNPEEPAIADIVFVHGLGGGSESTWTKSNDPSLYWPKQWLPYDNAFRDVRIHSFGYNANWDKSILNIHDFANSLLGSIQDCPHIPRGSTTPLVLVAHSMGGLVIKRTFILAKQKPEFSELARRIRTMIFLATPHRGADLAQLLTKMLSVTSGSVPFVADLHRSSIATQLINDEFPHYCKDLQLYSFYETEPMNFKFTKSLVVEKDLAILGYANERTSYLNADHRGVCKYNDTSDPNYRTVRNTLAYAVEPFRNRSLGNYMNDGQRKILDDFLGGSDALEDDLLGIDNIRMEGSCEWFINKEGFQQWRDSPNASLFWLSAKPATGKTVLSGKVINHLRTLYKDCQFFFFNNGDRMKSSISSFLLSMAWQMSHLHPEVLSMVLEIHAKHNQLSKTDYRAIWRKLFLTGILSVQFTRPQYWVIDGLDECKSDHELVPLLFKLVETGQVRVLVTSRDEFKGQVLQPSSDIQVVEEKIVERDTESDILLYLNAHVDEFPLVDESARRDMVSTILTKASGCFLWVKLVIEELRRVHTSGEIRQVLETVPSDMNDLYLRILDTMSEAKYGKHLAIAILVWTVCAIRPLTTAELHDALEIDLSDTIDDIKRSIVSSCGQVVYVDSHSRVQIVHQTARDFLLNMNIDSEFMVDKRLGHIRLAKKCLQFLNGKEMRGPFNRNLVRDNVSQPRSAFARYANTTWFQHLIHVPSTNDEVMEMLVKFLSSSNVLVWIESISGYSDLSLLIQAGKVLRNYLQRRSSHTAPVSKEVVLIDSWSNDLLRLVTKFGKKLLSSPPSIFYLIPPFCPLDTCLRKQFGSSPRGITVHGLSATTWDDCLSTISEPHEFFTALATSKAEFAIGMSSGRIVIHDQITCQRVQELRHREPVRILTFDHKGKFLVSASTKTIRLWDWVQGKEIWKIDIPRQCLLLEFADEDQLLLGVFKNNNMMVWDLTTLSLRDTLDWTADMEITRAHALRSPIFAAISTENLLAVIYRGLDIFVWDLEQDTVYETYNRNTSPTTGLERPSLDAGVICVAFCNAANTPLLAASYSGGDLVLFDLSENTIKSTILANAQVLACSPDGRTLASGDSTGVIKLYEFETLRLLYSISSDEDGIKDLVFSGDGRYILDIRVSQCRVWEPPVLMRQELDDENTDTVSVSTAQYEVDSKAAEDVISITALACYDSGEFIFCGREDGSVHLHSGKTGEPIQKLFDHAPGVSIISLQFDRISGNMTTGDDSGRVLIHNLVPRIWGNPNLIFECRTGYAVNQILSNSKYTKLLISSNAEDQFWSISAQENILVKRISWKDRGPYRWARHPSNDNLLILIIQDTLYLYDWSTLQTLNTPEKIQFQDTRHRNLNISSISSAFGQKYLALSFSEFLQPQFISKFALWSPLVWPEKSSTVASIANYQYLEESVRYLIGEYNRALVFLDNDGWVCSVGEQDTSYTRHFFLPDDWITTNITLLIQVTINRDLVFVKKNEVAVIKHGFDANQKAQSGPNRRLSLSNWRGSSSSSRS